ncbi:hypothetical protein KM800_03580 [Clostridium tyrobutyricum]|uniref:hypothetical protein n=1 Tax=Clostridium tyrobutyricum TaxID=1519 RepID=UPI001C38FF42|nr:hypothetical protein [Clostridium tyrobutyricum]MBV4418413.1 hypothetical protein [Clostridium tyrobutyricum]
MNFTLTNKLTSGMTSYYQKTRNMSNGGMKRRVISTDNCVIKKSYRTVSIIKWMADKGADIGI